MLQEPTLNAIPKIRSEKDFYEVLKLEQAVAYLKVNWSFQERKSRITLDQLIGDLNTDILPLFVLDLSSDASDCIENWLLNSVDFKHGGFGELLFIENGSIKDYIKYPGETGIEKTKEILNSWIE